MSKRYFEIYSENKVITKIYSDKDEYIRANKLLTIGEASNHPELFDYTEVDITFYPYPNSDANKLSSGRFKLIKLNKESNQLEYEEI